MNREIKFRIRLKCKKDGGGYSIGDTLVLFNEPFCPLNGVAFYNIDINIWDVVYVEQFTGLKDKHGNEIYHLDIVKDTGGNLAKVVWLQDDCSFCLEYDGITEALISPCDYIELIGNIFSNPDLIK